MLHQSLILQCDDTFVDFKCSPCRSGSCCTKTGFLVIPKTNTLIQKCKKNMRVCMKLTQNSTESTAKT